MWRQHIKEDKSLTGCWQEGRRVGVCEAKNREEREQTVK